MAAPTYESLDSSPEYIEKRRAAAIAALDGYLVDLELGDALRTLVQALATIDALRVRVEKAEKERDRQRRLFDVADRAAKHLVAKVNAETTRAERAEKNLKVSQTVLAGACLSLANEPDDEDVDDEFTEAIAKAHPLRTGKHALYAMARHAVSNRHSKGALVELVNLFMVQRDTERAARASSDAKVLAMSRVLEKCDPELAEWARKLGRRVTVKRNESARRMRSGNIRGARAAEDERVVQHAAAARYANLLHLLAEVRGFAPARITREAYEALAAKTDIADTETL